MQVSERISESLGLLTLGNKKDLWFGLDPETGNKVETLSSMTAERICPANKARAVGSLQNVIYNNHLF